MITNYASAGAGQVGETKPILSVLGTGTSILLGMPGAYTPTCTDIHLPGFYQAYSDFRRLGVSKIALITTNDRFVNAEWQKSMEQCQGVPEGESPIVMLSDARGDLAEALGLIGYLGRALGVRSKRFALVLQDGVVKYKAVDEGSDKASRRATALRFERASVRALAHACGPRSTRLAHAPRVCSSARASARRYLGRGSLEVRALGYGRRLLSRRPRAASRGCGALVLDHLDRQPLLLSC